MSAELDGEIDRNFFAFLPQIPDLLPQHRDEYAILRDRKIVGIHHRLKEALEVAQTHFGDGLFSIQQVTDKPIDLGFFSHAGYPG